MGIFALTISLFFSISFAQQQEEVAQSGSEYPAEAPLSAPVGALVHPINDSGFERVYLAGGRQDLSKNDVMSVLNYQTKVKSQGARNLCTVFAFTGLLESLILKKYKDLKTIDYSEEWAQYLVALRSPTGGGNGSTVPNNYSDVKKAGIAFEQYLPYDDRLWTVEAAPAIFKERCAGATGKDLKRCLASHYSPLLMKMSDAQLRDRNNLLYNPDFADAKLSANESKSYLSSMRGGVIKKVSRIKEFLRAGIPVTLEINVYYGTWNHAAGEKYGIDVDSSLYTKGIVTYPDYGSVDRVQSEKNVARHAVVVVGYDDSVEVTYNRLMRDGTTKAIKRNGVYYFKNSWGTNKFGNKFRLNSKSVPGFGLMLQDYANEFGQFFALSLGEDSST